MVTFSGNVNRQGHMDGMEEVQETIETSGELIVLTERLIRELPPILTGTMPGRIDERVEQFFLSVAQILEAWVAYREGHRNASAEGRLQEGGRGP